MTSKDFWLRTVLEMLRTVLGIGRLLKIRIAIYSECTWLCVARTCARTEQTRAAQGAIKMILN